MLVWVLALGEPIPTGIRAQDRLHRAGHLAYTLASLGHEVTWWTSSFDHLSKRHYTERDSSLRLVENLTVNFLHGPGYNSNVSLSRIRDQRTVALKFRHQAGKCPKRPDIILAALPPIELCSEAVKYGRDREVPVVLDMRDMWPDIMVDLAPKILAPLARTALGRMFQDAFQSCSRATAITGITEAFVDWGVRRGHRSRTLLDRPFPMAYASTPPPENETRVAERVWDSRGVLCDGLFTSCFIGTLGNHLDVETILEAAQIVCRSGRAMRFVLCGTGQRLPRLRRLVSGLPNVLLPGWANAAEIHVLLRRASLGIDPLPDRFDFVSTINNKAIEYMSAGLPVIVSPQYGVLHDLVVKERCGASYGCRDAKGLAALLIRLQDDKASVAEMSANSRRLFEREFVAEKVYRRMADYLVEVREAYTAARERGSNPGGYRP